MLFFGRKKEKTSWSKRARRALGMTMIALFLLLAGAVWVGGTYHIVNTVDGVRMVKKTGFSLTNILVSMDTLQRMSPETLLQRFPNVIEALRQDPYFADDIRSMVSQGVQSGVDSVTDTAAGAAGAVADGIESGLDAAQTAVGSL